MEDDAGLPTLGVERRSIRAIWADDEMANLYPYVELMRDHGVDVCSVCDGASALTAAQRMPVDLILLDLRLPDMNGLDVLKRLRAHHVSIPVVILTGFPGDVDEEAAAALDAQIVLKPTTPSKLAQLVKVEVARHGDRPATSAFRRPDGRSSSASEWLLVTLRQDGGDRGQLLAALAAALAADVTFFEWVAMAGTFHVLMTRPPAELPRLASRLAQALVSAADPPTARRDLVLRVVECVEAAGRGWRALTPAGVAASLRMPKASLEAGLQETVGRNLAVCCRAVVVRRGLLDLALTPEQVSQIAFRLGYEHPNVLNRDLTDLLSVSPREYRALLSHRARRQRGESA